jgi:hypothetical protein
MIKLRPGGGGIMQRQRRRTPLRISLALLAMLWAMAAGCDCQQKLAEVDDPPDVEVWPDVEFAIPPQDAGPDAARKPGRDAAPPGLDAAAPGLDAAPPPGLDAMPPGPDAAPPGLDAAPAGPDAETPCELGSVAGRVCAPDQQTWVGGATVSVDGVDCNGHPFHLEATSGSDGFFVINGIPTGPRTVHASLGAFQQDTAVVIAANQTTQIPDDALCVAQKAAKIAVITGMGDKIETLLTSLTLQYDIFDGTTSGWTGSGAVFLSDLTKMKTYDLIFIDCAAGKTTGLAIDLGPNAATITANLTAYAAAGGSFYTSDWALVFPALSFPTDMQFVLNGATSVTNPFATTHLMGYAPQTVTADVTDTGLAGFLGKGVVQISFPNATGANSNHWGLIQSIDPSANILIQGESLYACNTKDTNCSATGQLMTQVPLAVHFKANPVGAKGGNVVYTSFHNIAQPTDDVEKILKYIVLHL